ncbi:MAG TPA: hypothetical protein VJ725_26875 [Thermoanaerobaculia bacterium]|nr:hypothetical protein [Thermoanaerobaculia bacterium]
MALKNRVPASVREEYLDSLLQAENPREAARKLAGELEINFGAMWEWILRESQARAERWLPGPLFLRDLLQEEELQRVVALVEEDRTLATVHRLETLLRSCEASSDEIRDFVLSLPPDGAYDMVFETLISHPQTPLDLLFRLLREGRFEVSLCHRDGPAEWLEAVVRKMPQSSEAILGLAFSYLRDPDVPLERFLGFVREHRDCLQLRKWMADDFEPEVRDRDKLASARCLLAAEEQGIPPPL